MLLENIIPASNRRFNHNDANNTPFVTLNVTNLTFWSVHKPRLFTREEPQSTPDCCGHKGRYLVTPSPTTVLGAKKSLPVLSGGNHPAC